MITEIKKTKTSFLGSLPSSSKIIAVSSNGSDTQTLQIAGSGVESLVLDGTDHVTGTVAFTSITSLALSASSAGTVSIYSEGVAGGAVFYLPTGTLAENDTVVVTVNGVATTYLFKDAGFGSTTAYHVKVGASNAESVENLCKAINNGPAGTGSGTAYGDTTPKNKYVTATYTSGSTFSVTDNIKIRRAVLPTMTCSRTGSVCTPFTTGTTGTLLAQLTTGETSVTGILSLTNPTLSLDNIPANTKFVSDWTRTYARPCALRFKCEDVATPLPVSYQTSLDGVSFYADGEGSIPDLDGDLAPTYYSIPEISEYVRVLVSNDNASGVSVHGNYIIQG